MHTVTLSLQQEALSVVKSSLELKKKSLEFNLEHYRKRLQEFERKYGMNSTEFLARFNEGELGDDPQWFEWEYLVEVYQETKKQLTLLEQIRL